MHDYSTFFFLSWRFLRSIFPQIDCTFFLHQKSTLVDIPMLQFTYCYTQR